MSRANHSSVSRGTGRTSLNMTTSYHTTDSGATSDAAGRGFTSVLTDDRGMSEYNTSSQRTAETTLVLDQTADEVSALDANFAGRRKRLGRNGKSDLRSAVDGGEVDDASEAGDFYDDSRNASVYDDDGASSVDNYDEVASAEARSAQNERSRSGNGFRTSRTGMSSSYYTSDVTASDNARSFSYNGDTTSDVGSRTYDFDQTSFDRSPSQGDQSSTFTSFYLESDVMRRLRATINSLRRPIVFFTAIAAGSSGLNSIFRLVYTVHVAAVQGRAAFPFPLRPTVDPPIDMPAFPLKIDGYPPLPEWTQAARKSIPPMVERAATALLHSLGVPAFVELQRQRFQQSTTRFAEMCSAAAAASAAAASHSFSPLVIDPTTVTPGIPTALLLPIFSAVIVLTAKNVVATCMRARRGPAQSDFDDLLDDDDAAVSIRLREEGKNDDAESHDALEDDKDTANMLNYSRSQMSFHREAETTTHSVDLTVDDDRSSEPTHGRRLADEGRFTPRTMTLRAHHEAVEAAARRGEGRHYDRDLSPSLPSTSPQSVELSPYARGDDAASKKAPPSASAASATTVPDGNVAESGIGRPRNGPDASLPPLSPSSPIAAQPGGSPMRIQGDVTLAVMEGANEREVGVMILTAARFGCRRVVLPAVLRGLLNVASMPSSLAVEFVANVAAHIGDFSVATDADVVGVYTDRTVDGAVELLQYPHPRNVVYVFQTRNPQCVASIKSLADDGVYVEGDDADSDQPMFHIGRCLVDRLSKERRSRSSTLEP